MAKRNYKNHQMSDSFDICIGMLFGDNVRDKITTAYYSGPEAECSGHLMVTYADLISIWNSGVTHGVEGYQEKLKSGITITSTR